MLDVRTQTLSINSLFILIPVIDVCNSKNNTKVSSLFSAFIRTFGMSGVSARAFSANDGREKTSGSSIGGVQRSGGSEGS